MEMIDLERAWQGLDQRLAGLEQQARQQRVHRTFTSIRARLRLLTLGQVVQLAVATAIVVVAGPFWVGHWGTPHLVVYGVAIHLYGLALLIAALTQLMAVWRIDYRQPVLVVQKRLLQLAWFRVRSERWLLVAGFVAWVPLVFALAAVAGLDVWLFKPSIVLLNLAVGIGLAGGAAWLTGRFRDRFACDAAGRSLREAERELAALLDPESGH